MGNCLGRYWPLFHPFCLHFLKYLITIKPLICLKVVQNFQWDLVFDIYVITQIYKIEMIFGKSHKTGMFSEWDFNTVEFIILTYFFFNLSCKLRKEITALCCSQIILCLNIVIWSASRNYEGLKWTLFCLFLPLFFPLPLF